MPNCGARDPTIESRNGQFVCHRISAIYSLYSYMLLLCYITKADSAFPIHGRVNQVAELSQRNRAAVWVSFGWVVDDSVGQ